MHIRLTDLPQDIHDGLRPGMSATAEITTKTVPNDIMREYYRQRAEGGAGLIVTEGVLVTRQGCVSS